MQRATQLLYAVAGFFLLAGLVLRVLPAPGLPSRAQTPASRSRLEGKSRPTPRPVQDDTTIINGNIFSASRSAPRMRYTPPDLAPSPELARPVARAASPGLHLLGTVSGTAALMDADPKIPGAEIYQIGDVIRGKRLVAVLDSTAVLEGPTGRTVLKLQQPKPSTP
jgi:hypothetical protein